MRLFLSDYLNFFTRELGNCSLGNGSLTGKMDEAASETDVQGARYPEKPEAVTGR